MLINFLGRLTTSPLRLRIPPPPRLLRRRRLPLLRSPRLRPRRRRRRRKKRRRTMRMRLSTPRRPSRKVRLHRFPIFYIFDYRIRAVAFPTRCNSDYMRNPAFIHDSQSSAKRWIRRPRHDTTISPER